MQPQPLKPVCNSIGMSQHSCARGQRSSLQSHNEQGYHSLYVMLAASLICLLTAAFVHLSVRECSISLNRRAVHTCGRHVL